MTNSLNFVWINAVRETSLKPEDFLSCPIPELYRQNVARIAQSMPSLPITIWVDVAGVGNNSVEIVKAVGAQSNIPNVTFRSLDDVPAYHTNPVFEKASVNLDRPYDPLWQQVDMARLLVLDHCLSDGDHKAIYSDFNRDISPEIIKESMVRLETQGFVVGDGFQSGFQGYLYGDNKYSNNFRPENQFIGVSKTQHSFFRNEVCRLSAHGIEHGSNGWEGFSDAFKLHALQSYRMTIHDIAITVPRIQNARSAKEHYGQTASKPLSAQSAPPQP